NFVNNSARYGGAVYFRDYGTVTNCNFTNNTATQDGGAVYFNGFYHRGSTVTNCSFISNNAKSNGGAIRMLSGSVANCNFTNNTATQDGGAVYFEGHFRLSSTVTNCNFTGNNATTGSAIYFGNNLETKTVSNSIFLNNRANAEALEVTKNENNITITFTGNNNLLNAIHSRNNGEVTFTNVTYWSANGINSTGNFPIKPPRSNRQAGQNITLEIFDSDDKLVENVTLVTDINGQAIYDLAKLSTGKFRYNVYHFEDSYYTYAESNGTFTNGLGDFNILQKYINEAAADSVLTLNRSYTFTVGMDENLADGIVIGKPITINGNGYTINALNKARIFKVTADNVVLNNITFTNANASGEGGAVYFDGNGNVTNCHFTDNSAENGGALYIMVDGKVENCSFTNNSAYNAGAIHFMGTGNVAKCNFIDNKATSGGAGAIDIYSGSIENCNFANNTATSDGGAVCFYLEGNVTNCTFTDNKGEYGGALYFSWDGTVTSCDFTNNQVTGDYVCGGAVYFNNNGTVIKCVFTHNKATGNESCGGAVCINFNGTVTNCSFTDNQAVSGGAVYFYKNVEGNVTDCSFNNNSADHGGAIYFDSESSGRLVNCNFTNNSANRYGGAINMRSGSVTNCTFVNNAASRGGAILMGSGSVTNCNFVNNTVTGDYSFGGAAFFDRTGELTNCNFTNNSAYSGGAVYCSFYNGVGIVKNCNFNNNKATSFGGALGFVRDGELTYCNFVNNTASGDGGAIYFLNGNGEIANCNFTGNNATTGSAIYFWSTLSTKTISNSRFLNNRANADALEVTKNENNITITFTGQDNLLNAIYSRNDEVTFNNVFYWSANGINNTGNSAIKPTRSNKEPGQNITVGVVVDDVIVLEEVKVTDENGMIVLDIIAGENYYIGVRHDTDSYYTEALNIISNNTKFNVNVTSQTTNNKTVNITAKSNIPNEVIKGKLRFILPNGDEVNASYAGNGIWWTKYTFDDYGVYEVNASYSGLDNVTLNNGTVTISKFNSTISARNKTVTYPSDVVLVTAGENCTGINKSSVVIRNPDGTLADANVVVDGFSITISGLGAGNYTVYYNNTVNSNCNVAGNFTGITVLKANSSVSATDVEVTYGDLIVVVVDSKNATKVSYQIISSGAIVKEGLVNVGENITGLDLGADEYTVNLTTVVNANFTASNYKSKITVNPASSYVSAGDVEVTYGEEIVIPVSTVNAVALYYDIVDENNTVVVSDIIESGLNITVNGLSAGRYNVTYITGVDLNHTSVRNASKITVSPAGSCVSASYVAVNFGEAISIAVSSVNATEISYSIIDSNKKSVVNGSVKPGEAISVSDLAAGDYTVSLNTVTDANHTAISNSSKLHIRHVVTITIAPVTGYAGEIISITAEFKYENGDPAGEGTAGLTIKYEDKEVLGASMNSLLSADESVPVSGGKATFNVKLTNPGIYPYVVAYSGEDVDPVQGESTITVLKVNTTVSCSDISGKPTDKKDVTVTVSDHNNKSVENGTVTLTLNGKTYNATVENGKAVLSIELPNPGEYNATVTYNGNGYYNSTTSSIGVNVEKMNTKAPLAGDITGKAGEKTDITVKFVDEKGNPVKNGTATLTIDGKTYTSDVINGSATFKDVVIPEKDTVADVYYQSNDYYNASSATFSVKVKHDSNNTDKNRTEKHVSSKAADGQQTGNPIAMMLLALMVMVITYRKK
ncbi:right-handed parallel beta-helix repeat-containing protein, partial [Methanobrevibacter sp.]|uniref:right-handed parallel beta-helix repeat-containing protein n=1 Tax=Methanobrevibacter sp. TaxID=66852 RepID=UPI0025EA8623